ncbi:MAG: hypothetical protein PVJ27_04975, partial [Candidatus Brocadiaceae bacterium]
DMGLATMMLFGVVMAVLAVTQTISREIESQTVGAILSKPVGRLMFVLAKFLGVTGAMAVAIYLLSVVLLTVLRIGVPSRADFAMDWPALCALTAPFVLACIVGAYCNYFYRLSFPSTAVLAAVPLYALGIGVLLLIGRYWQFDVIPPVFAERHAAQVAKAAVLVWLAVWVVSSIALAASTRLNVLLNAILCLTVFFVGMISQFLFGQFAETSGAAWLASHAVPNLHYFWVGDKLMQELPFIPIPYVGMAAVYAAGYCATMVMLAAFLFERREVA